MRGTEYDEQQQERREQQYKKKMNMQFVTFARQIEEYTERMQADSSVTFPKIKFDVPLRKLAFKGVAQKGMATITPTVNCLVELVNYPFTVIFLEDIDRVFFERVDFNLRSCDMVIIFKDIYRNPAQIKSIEMKSLDMIKKWLEQVGITVSELSKSIAWPKVLAYLRKDPEAFFKEGGWSILDVCSFLFLRI